MAKSLPNRARLDPSTSGPALWYFSDVAPAPIDDRERNAAARMSAACDHEANQYGVSFSAER